MQSHKLGILSKNEHQIFSVTFWVIRKKYPHAYVWVKIDKVSLCLERTSVALDSGSGSQKMAFVYREQQSYWSAWLKLCGNSSKMPKTPKLWEHFYESSGNTSWQPAERNSTRTPFLCRWIQVSKIDDRSQKNVQNIRVPCTLSLFFDRPFIETSKNRFVQVSWTSVRLESFLRLIED